MLSSTASPRQRSAVSVAFASAARVLFTTLLFVAGGMAVGLFFGIIGTILYGTMRGASIDMTNAYRHVAIPLAGICGCVAVVGSIIQELRARRGARRSRST